MRKLIFLLLLLFCQMQLTQAQALLNTMGVENGNLNNWACKTGTCCPVNAQTAGVVSGRHTIVSGNSLDTFGNFPKVCPWGGNHSMRIGNDTAGAQAESASFIYTVDSLNYYVTIAYAAVVELAGHSTSSASRFYFKVKDNLGNDIFSSAQCAYCNNNPYPTNLQTSNVNGNVKYLPWTQQVLNLKHYINQQITFEVVAGDDSSGNQFGYGYFDLVSAGKLTASDSRCGNSNNITLLAPLGYQNYKWFDSSFNYLSSASNIYLTSTNWNSQLFNKKYFVAVTPFAGQGIVDTILYKVKGQPRNAPNAGFSTSLLCNNITIIFLDTAYSSIYNDPTATVRWNFGDVFSSVANDTSVLISPSHQFFHSGNFTITQTITSIYNCSSTLQQQIFVNSAPIANAGKDDSICKNQSFALGGNPSATGGSGNYTYLWSSTGSIANVSVANPVGLFNANSFAILNVTDNLTQCNSSDTVQISIASNCVNHPPIAVNDTLFIAYTQSKTINVLANDIDKDGNIPPQANLTTASVTLVGSSFHGNVSVASNQIQYTPIVGFTGVDSIRYVVCDNGNPYNYCDTGILLVHVYNQLAVNIGTNFTQCFGTMHQFFPVVSGGSGSFQYSWSSADSLNCTNCFSPIFHAYHSTFKHLKVIDLLSLQQDSSQIFITVDTPKLSLGNDVFTTANHPSIALQATNLGSSNISTYSWNPTPTGICNNCSNPIYAPTTTTNVVASIIDNNNCTATDTIIIYACSTDCVYPGDVDRNNVANNFDIFNIGLGYGFTGSPRPSVTNVWDGYPAINWNDSVANLNAKYADCNGDGIIDANDTAAIVLNYKNIHNTTSVVGLPLNITLPHTVLKDSLRVYCGISLGTNAQQGDSVYGVAFTFNYDPLVVDTNTIHFNLNTPNWLFANSTDNIYVEKYYRSKGAIDVGLVRSNHIAKSGYGIVASITIDITTGNIAGRLSSQFKDYILHCSLTNIRVIDYHGNIISTVGNADSATIEYQSTGIENLVWMKSVSLIPNPAQNEFALKASSDVALKSIEIQNIFGEKIRTMNFENNSNQKEVNIITQNLANGIYIVSIETNKGKVMKQLVIQH